MGNFCTGGQVLFLAGFVFSGFSFETVLFFGDVRFYRNYFFWTIGAGSLPLCCAGVLGAFAGAAN
jgi:hypothetical protein